MPADRPGGEVLTAVPEGGGAWRSWLFWLATGLALVPLLASAVHVLGEGRLYNLGDNAGIEMRTRDVGHHVVMLGLWSRSDWNHPGPALFYLLALPYRLMGSNPAGLQVGALLINGAAVLGMAMVARRRGGLALSLLTLLGCSILLRALGPAFWSNTWNPSIPVLPFGLVVLLCWSITCNDVWALPVAAGVASFCIQTHVGYAPLALPLFGAAALVLGIRVRRSVSQQPLEPKRRRAIARACILTAAVLGVVWLPPIADQVLHRPGNMVRIARYFAHPDAGVATLGGGFRVVAGQFGLVPSWVSGNDKSTLSLEPALLRSSPAPLLLVPLVLAGILLWRRRSFEAAALVVTVVAALVLGILAVYRTIVPVYAYRLKWTWTLGMLGAVSIAWTTWLLMVPRFRGMQNRYLMPAAVGGLVVLGVVNASAAIHAATPWKDESAVLSKLVPAIGAALPHRQGDVVVRTADLQSIMYQGIQLALERRGIAARTDDPTGIVGNGSEHRVHRRGPVRAILTVATSNGINGTFAHANEHLIAYSGSVSAKQRISIANKRLELFAQKAGSLRQKRAYIELAGLSKNLRGPEVAIFIIRPGERANEPCNHGRSVTNSVCTDG